MRRNKLAANPQRSLIYKASVPLKIKKKLETIKSTNDNSSGMICSSISVIKIAKRQKAINNKKGSAQEPTKDEIEQSGEELAQFNTFEDINTKRSPVESSVIGYTKGIFFLQLLHFPFRRIKERRGILSYQLICFLHCGQYDLPFGKSSPIRSR